MYVAKRNLFFRYLLNEKLKSSFSKITKNRHKEICKVNIKVNVIVWLVEVSSGIFMSLDFLILGNRNNAITGLLRVFILLSFFVLVPCTYLIKWSEGVNTIVDKGWWSAIERIFKTKQKRNNITSDESKGNRNDE